MAHEDWEGGPALRVVAEAVAALWEKGNPRLESHQYTGRHGRISIHPRPQNAEVTLGFMVAGGVADSRRTRELLASVNTAPYEMQLRGDRFLLYRRITMHQLDTSHLLDAIADLEEWLDEKLEDLRDPTREGADWVSFAYSLATTLSRLGQDRVFELCLDEGEVDEFDFPFTPKFIQYCANGPGQIRVELVHNQNLDDPHKFTAAQEERILKMGWTEPVDDDGAGSPNYFLDVESIWVDFAAELAVRMFRDIWDVKTFDQIVTDKADLRLFRWLEAPSKMRPSADT